MCYRARMQAPPTNNRPVHIYGTKTRQTSIGVTEFLRGTKGLAALMPAAMRMASLQQDIAAALPSMFHLCDVLSFEDGLLMLATPSSAVAAKLKQMLPKVQGALQQRGWNVGGIRLKVQPTRAIAPVVHTRALVMPETALNAFEELSETLAPTAANATLIAAIKAMAARRR